MADTKGDWKILRGALGLCAVCVLLSGALVFGTDYFWQQMNREYTTHYTRFREVSRKYLAVDDDERVIHDEYPKFVALYHRGVLGDEHRLSWIEALRLAATTLALPKLDYKLDAQQLFTPPFALNSGPFAVNASNMHLSLELLHEGDLINLLDYLDRHAEGLYSVEQCTLTRNVVTATTAGVNAANLRAECVLRWLTLDQQGDAKIRL